MADANGDGYDVLRADGTVDAYGTTNYGSLAATSLAPGVTATGIALDATTGGYWILASDGSVTPFNAPSYGETLVPSGGWGQHPAAVAIAAAPGGAGYYVLRANGAVYG
jgi:3D (Asp-Asp-Asp) domain-containing protein